MEDNNLNKIEGEWDQYWLRSSKKKSINKIYDFFAYIYRNFLIGPSFKYYMYKHFNKNSDILLKSDLSAENFSNKPKNSWFMFIKPVSEF